MMIFYRSNFRCEITRRRFQQDGGDIEGEISEYYEYRFKSKSKSLDKSSGQCGARVINYFKYYNFSSNPIRQS